MNNKNIILIGFMGVGKSFIGRMLSERINYKFIDVDELIEDVTKMTIKEIFLEQGEEKFRAIESEVIEDISKTEKTIIATGGGAVLNPNNIYKLKENGFIIHLNASYETIVKNLINDTNRPLIYNENLLDKITELLEKRKYCYDCYDAQINIDGLTIEGIIDTICDILKGNGFDEC